MKVQIGTYVNVTFKSSSGIYSVYKCIIGDSKGTDAGNAWGHYGGKGVVEVIYHNYSPPKKYHSALKNNPWGKGKVTRISTKGKY